ncbi:hypothetical protein CQ018_17000 [Arthrobacter sp. MYb227]|uniref:DUF3027 domain-containing protein n=1 Tax=Arthrobacter sp. MYb227 TaxID=1848601 RepID=UPI000CFD22D9|nr:DUF3027 domain-containing protein [Arthrobacter sp. MYb227]PQZ88144.1 hypothetical protein CQ018_17000 [Arthrobacter sp. MYb227]
MARKPKLDETLAAAKDRARTALLAITEDATIGEHVDVICDGDRLVTHRFVTLQPGYEGWCWFATLTRVPRAQAKDITVCEVGILPGEDALLAPAWVPWAERVRPEELDAEREAREEALNGSTGESVAAQEQDLDAPDTTETGEADEADELLESAELEEGKG